MVFFLITDISPHCTSCEWLIDATKYSSCQPNFSLTSLFLLIQKEESPLSKLL